MRPEIKRKHRLKWIFLRTYKYNTLAVIRRLCVVRINEHTVVQSKKWPSVDRQFHDTVCIDYWEKIFQPTLISYRRNSR